MKERMTLAVSWWCFVHASLLGLAALLTAANFLGADINEAMSALEPLELYFHLFPTDALIFEVPLLAGSGCGS